MRACLRTSVGAILCLAAICALAEESNTQSGEDLYEKGKALFSSVIDKTPCKEWRNMPEEKQAKLRQALAWMKKARPNDAFARLAEVLYRGPQPFTPKDLPAFEIAGIGLGLSKKEVTEKLPKIVWKQEDEGEDGTLKYEMFEVEGELRIQLDAKGKVSQYTFLHLSTEHRTLKTKGLLSVALGPYFLHQAAVRLGPPTTPLMTESELEDPIHANLDFLIGNEHRVALWLGKEECVSIVTKAHLGAFGEAGPGVSCALTVSVLPQTKLSLEALQHAGEVLRAAKPNLNWEDEIDNLLSGMPQTYRPPNPETLKLLKRKTPEIDFKKVTSENILESLCEQSDIDIRWDPAIKYLYLGIRQDFQAQDIPWETAIEKYLGSLGENLTWVAHDKIVILTTESRSNLFQQKP